MVKSGLGDVCKRSINEDDRSTSWAFAGKTVVDVTACMASTPIICSCDDKWDGMAMASETSSGSAGKGIIVYNFKDDSEGLDGMRLTVDANSRGLVCFPSDSDVDNDWSVGRATSTASGIKGEVRGDCKWSGKRDSAFRI
jgi:hypothetical protein